MYTECKVADILLEKEWAGKRMHQNVKNLPIF